MNLHCERFPDERRSLARHQELLAAARRHPTFGVSLYHLRYNSQRLVAVVSEEPLPADFLAGSAAGPVIDPAPALRHALGERRRLNAAAGPLREQHYGPEGGRPLDRDGRLHGPCGHRPN